MQRIMIPTIHRRERQGKNIPPTDKRPKSPWSPREANCRLHDRRPRATRMMNKPRATMPTDPLQPNQDRRPNNNRRPDARETPTDRRNGKSPVGLGGRVQGVGTQCSDRAPNRNRPSSGLPRGLRSFGSSRSSAADAGGGGLGVRRSRGRGGVVVGGDGGGTTDIASDVCSGRAARVCELGGGAARDMGGLSSRAGSLPALQCT